jgi:hypothetical protein
MSKMANVLVVVVAVFVGLLLTEVASRYFLPISAGAQLYTPEGIPVDRFNYKANTKYRQISSEFDALTTIDSLGNRASGTTVKPHTLFVGDSFTFGHGLADEETFVNIYCKTLNQECANLGRPGIGTTKEMEILENSLSANNWRPSVVKLFFLGMSDTLMSGNDLYDNYLHIVGESHGGPAPLPKGLAPHTSDKMLLARDDLRESLRRAKNLVMKYSNLGRIFYFSFGHYLRASFSPPASAQILEIGLTETRIQLEKFTQLSKKFGFTAEVYVIHPVQDLIRGTTAKTINVLQKAIPKQQFIPTAHVFEDTPRKYYFSYDGHWNATGAQKFADFLILQSQ